MEERILQLETELARLKSDYYMENYSSKQVIRKDLDLLGTIQHGANGKLGFFGVAPVVKQASIGSPSSPSGVYVQAEASSMKTAVDAIIARLVAYGLIS
jgi:hypothetical protein